MNVRAAHDIAILWSRLDRTGTETVRLRDSILEGTAVFEHDGGGCSLHYWIECDAQWRTVSAGVAGWVGNENVDIVITVVDGRWTLNGAHVAGVEGCIDIDLNFSPSTNLLPIRRLNLAVGDAADVRAAWLRFPTFALEPLDQRYIRTGERSYRYESAGGSFIAELEVDEAGFVVHYPGFARAVIR